MSEWVIDYEKIKDPNARSEYGTEFAIDKHLTGTDGTVEGCCLLYAMEGLTTA